MSAVYLDKDASVEARVEDLLAQMTTDEKIAQLSSIWSYEVLDKTAFSEEKADHLLKAGIGQITRIGGASSLDPVESAKLANRIQKYLAENTRLAIPAMVHEESCSGYMAKGATCFPQTIGVASTWNPALVHDMGVVIREQMKSVGAHQALAPLLDITRDARWGRSEETFGEDPYLVSQMGLSYVKGLQTDDIRDGVIATGKHFVGYGISEGGMNWAPAHIPSRELREDFLLPFEAVVKEGKLGAIMPAYHELDGVPCHTSKKLLIDTLRTEWGFVGLVVSDYFAINMLYEYHHLAKDKMEAAKLALEAGVDVELPSMDCYADPIKQMLKQGTIDVGLVDAVVRRVLAAKFRMGLFENPYVDVERVEAVFDTKEQRSLAHRIAQESMVLLKNENNVLPLSRDLKTIAVIGPNADSVRNIIGDYAYPCHIETLIEMRDSANVFNTPVPENLEMESNFVPIISILQAIRDRAPEGAQVLYAQGADVTGSDASGIAEAVRLVELADIAIVVVGDKPGLTNSSTSGESRDRADLNLPGVQQQLVEAVYQTGTPIVAVLVNGRPLSIPWLDEHVPAILEAWLPGEEGAAAVADVLFGDYNPGGKLPMSFPRSVGQVPVYYNHKPSGGRSHWKGDYVEMSTKPLYPFGYGLSYTAFEYLNLVVKNPELAADGQVEIQVDVKNVGAVRGDETVQLYIHDSEATVTRPVKQLKGFKRITLEVGETKTVAFHLPVSSLGLYNHDMEYVVEPGQYEVMVGTSSEDIRLTGAFNVVGKTTVITNRAFTTLVEA
ncbi:glycoside hydrolase family 3 N-terminal domain-containing protein [Alicyclobacillus ferrooxydans]|uniref:Beta-xylosidase n=1 Tax=Alicyclobacillus ferrooxydans TaxID=471514 RepID=A0A0P9CDC4_9BACL|nr:glycoside hydrolase family 3 N-terminal domain-containing protein [Alicyclobacillus ferrooxydans]KPV40841.1 beta-xylosidase [Alicyclobacillus ferrooxydans]